MNQKMYIVEISNGKEKIYNHRGYLARSGCTFVKRSYGKSFYTKKVGEEEKTSFVKYCKKHKLTCAVIDEKYTRNNSYRKEFLEQYKNNSHILCAYCGLLVDKKDITVDHIIPVDKAKKGKGGARMLMNILRVDNVNNQKNLAAACKKCNNRKRTKMGFWVIKGFIGKSKCLWTIRWLLRIGIIIAIIAIVYMQ